MNISIISSSHRDNSESARIANIFEKKLSDINQKIKINKIDLGKLKPPMWNENLNNSDNNWKSKWKLISLDLNKSIGFVFIVPEYGGMATPQAKNFFLLCDQGELFHKPGLIVSVSSGNGGAYPISDLRASSYKNTHVMWIPENIIIKSVQEYNPGAHSKNIPNWLDSRVDYCLNLLILYAKNMRNLSKTINRRDFGNGM